MKKGPITIKDIARELGISPSTVSRALADNPLVKKSTKESVKSLAEKYKYEPNYTALSLRSNKTSTIGVIIPQLVHEFFASVIRGIEDFAYSNDYNVIICSTHENHEREVIDAQALLSGKVDGLLACISRDTKNFDHFKAFPERGIPLVFYDCICDEIDTHKVVIDDLNAGYVATKHLLEQGRSKVAYLGAPINLSINKDRFNGYKKALMEAGVKFNENLVEHCPSGNFDDGMTASGKILDRSEIDGLFASTDMLAIGAVKSLKKYGFDVPKDVGVVGFSDWTISALYEPSLSTIHQPGYEMGVKSAEMLINQIADPDNDNFETVVLQTELIVRESSKP